MRDEKSAKKESKPTAPPVIIKKTVGVWKFLTFKEPAFSLERLLLMEWKKYTSAIPGVFRLLWDIYHLNPPLVLFYLASRVWKGIEPGMNMLELYLRDEKGNPATVLHVKTSGPSSWMSWHCFAEMIEATVEILGLFSIVTSILYQHHGGTIFTALCLIYPIVGGIVKYQWSQAMVIVAENADYIRLKALGNLGRRSHYREDIVNNNIADHIMKGMNRVEIQAHTAYEPFFRVQDVPSAAGISFHWQSYGILYTLETIKGIYHAETLRLLDGTVNYQPPCDTKGISFELRNVSFIYPGSQSNDGALKNVSVDVKAGQLVIVVGTNGSGKSTLIKLLTRTYDVTSGEILLNGVPIQTYKLTSLRNVTSILSQDHSIWPLSLAENVGLGYAACAANEEMINTAVEKGGANGVVARLSDGLATILDPVETAVSFGIELPRHQALQDVLEVWS
ncbi:hypothetical protein C0995_007314 [Termitomyces sp. Mi166|nr:hypothetical protein C0995_007314 [Termitomyces sp. Mi166\